MLLPCIAVVILVVVVAFLILPLLAMPEELCDDLPLLLLLLLLLSMINIDDVLDSLQSVAAVDVVTPSPSPSAGDLTEFFLMELPDGIRVVGDSASCGRLIRLFIAAAGCCSANDIIFP